jgi:regulator of replication initiation timing
MVDNMKIQLSDKDKEISNLREKVNTLRKNNQILQLQVNSRAENYTIAEEIKNSPKYSKVSKKSKTRLDESKRRVWKKPPVSDG